MNILIYTNIIPFPLDEGGKVAQYGFIESLVENGHQVTLVSTGIFAKEEQLTALKRKLPGLNSRFIKAEVEEKKIGIGQKLVRRFAWEFKKRVKEINDKSPVLQSEGFMQPVKSKNKNFVTQWIKILEEIKPELVQVDFIDNADLALLVPDTIKKVIVLHDLRFSSVKQAAQLSRLPASFTDYLTGFVKTTEIAYMDLFDAILTFSKEDVLQLSGKINPHKIYTAPFSILDNRFKQLTGGYSISKLVFIGPDHHYPNLDAIHWYAESIGQLLYDRWGFKLTVIGKWSDANKAIFQKTPFIKFEGFVEDINDAVKNAALIVPLRIGSGIRTKIMEAFAMGVPVITTTLGCEGLAVKDAQEIIIANEADQFAVAVDMLINDGKLTDSIRFHAQQLATLYYSQAAAYKNRISIYRNLMDASLDK